MGDKDYLVQLPDGRWIDTRGKFRRGDRVRVTSGPNVGVTGAADSLVGQIRENGRWITMAGYHVRTDDGRNVTVRWDELEALSSGI